LKSTKLFTQAFGGIADAYVELEEFENLEGCEKFYDRSSKDEEWTKIDQEFMLLIDPCYPFDNHMELCDISTKNLK
jgi:hypothetical protein